MIAPKFGLFLFLDLLAASPGTEAPEPLRIYGGEIAKPCEFPTTIAGRDACTGTLVHPRVILSAAHCGKHREFLIGEYKSKAAKRIKAKWCETGPVDAQICVLAKPLEGLPLAPIIQGCESEALKGGEKIYLAGYGYDENDPVGDGSVRDEKRWVQTEIIRVTGSEVHVGGGGKTACNGDSGGPAFLKLKDGTWRTVGATYATLTGGAHPNCKTAKYKRTDKLLGWYQKQLDKHNENINLSPCFDKSGAWKPTKDCGGYTKDVQGPYGSWDNNCGEGVPVVKYSATCGEPFAPNDEGDEATLTVAFARGEKDIVAKEGESIELKAKLSDASAVESVTLMKDDQKVEEKDKAPFEWTLQDLKAGTFTLQLHAKANGGSTVKSKPLSLKVQGEDEEDSPQDPEGSTDPKDSPEDTDSGGTDTGENDSGSKDSPGDRSGKGSNRPDDPGGEDSSEPDPPKKGCQMDSTPLGMSAWLLLLLAWRRRSEA